MIIGKLCTGYNLAPAQLSTIPNCQWDCLRTHYHHCFGALPQSSLTEKNVKWKRTTLLSVRALPKFQNVKLAFFPLWFEFEIVQTREAQGRNHRPQWNSSWHTDQYYRSTAACLNPGNQIKRDTMNTKKWYWYTQSGWLRHHICLNGSGNSIFFYCVPLLAGIEMQMPSSGPSMGVRARYWCRGMRDGWAGPG